MPGLLRVLTAPVHFLAKPFVNRPRDHPGDAPSSCDDASLEALLVESAAASVYGVPPNPKVVSVDERDMPGPDNWIPRHSKLVRLTGKHPFNCEPPLPLLMADGFLTSVALHYVRDHGSVPKKAWEDHVVHVNGAVPRELALRMKDIVAMPATCFPCTLVCAGNRRKEENMLKQTIGFSWGPAGLATTLLTGVRLRDVLHRAGVMKPTPDAQFVCFRGPVNELPKGEDGSYGTSIPLHMALDPAADVILAYRQNNAKLEPDHGYPIRVVIPGYIGGRMVKWLEEITVSKEPSANYYHFHDNRILPPHVVDSDLAAAEGWWYKPEYIFNQLNINSAISHPAHNEVIVVSKDPREAYEIKGYAYTGGGRKITRIECSTDNGLTWQRATIIRHEEPTEYGMYWCWVFFELLVNHKQLAAADQLMCRAWDEANNTQPNHITWNLMGMGNNCVFRVKVNKQCLESGTLQLHFEQPTQPGTVKGGWMGSEADGWTHKQRGDNDITRF